MGLDANGFSVMQAALLPAGTNRYFALYEDEDCTVELSVDGYDRVGYNGWSTTMDGKSRSNTAAITWATWPNGGQFRGLAVLDAAVGGNMLFHASVKTLALDPTVIVGPGDFPQLDVDALTVLMDNAS